MKALRGEAKAKPNIKNNITDKYDALFWRKPANLILGEIRFEYFKKKEKV